MIPLRTVQNLPSYSDASLRGAQSLPGVIAGLADLPHQIRLPCLKYAREESAQNMGVIHPVRFDF